MREIYRGRTLLTVHHKDAVGRLTAGLLGGLGDGGGRRKGGRGRACTTEQSMDNTAHGTQQHATISHSLHTVLLYIPY